jgi:hypothetical protein
MGTMDLGSWFTQSSLSIYGDDHVIDDKSKYNCHDLMITLWQLYVLKHIAERSTHMCLLVSPSCEASVFCHSITSYFSLFSPR